MTFAPQSRSHISSPKSYLLYRSYADGIIPHDAIVGAKGAFVQITFLHNLALLKQRIEIRIVILKQNYRYLPAWPSLYMKLPLCGAHCIHGS